MARFRSLADGAIELELDEFETDVLRRLVAELREIIGGRGAGDPVTERLFPAAYDDPADEEAYRDLTADSLEQDKLLALETVAASLPDHAGCVTLDPAEVGPWLASLTDLRLAIGTRLEVDEDRMAGPVESGDPDSAALTVLHWLGYVQEGLLRTAR